MEYYAHYRKKSNGEEPEGQTVEEHLMDVAKHIKESASELGVSNLGYLIGILHDMGKFTEEFSRYLEWSFHHPNDYSKRGSVDHSTAGAKYIFEKYKAGADFERMTAEFIALPILSHHTGLLNFLGYPGNSDLLRRVT